MDELAAPKLARPMDKSALGNDEAMLRSLVGMLNDPNLTGAVLVEEPNKFPATAPLTSEVAAALTEASAKFKTDKKALQAAADAEASIMAAAMASPADELAPVAAAPAPQGPTWKLPPGVNRIFFTGAPKAGKSWLATQLGARLFEMDDPIVAMARSAFGDYKQESYSGFAYEVYAWGEGVVNKNYPLTAARSLFVENIRSIAGSANYDGIFEGFGTAGFWIRALLNRVTKFHLEFPKEVAVVTDIGTADQYQALRSAGFLHFHVYCHNLTRQARGGVATVSPLVASIEQNLTKAISKEPRGAKLWCVWSDDHYQVPSGRMLSVQEFLGGVK